jgi:hypothetical protein
MSATTTLQLNNVTGSRTNPAVTVQVDIEFAPDGATWSLLASETFVPGGHTHDGTPITTFSINTDIPEEGAARKLRGTLNVIGGRITTPVNITTTP